MSNLVAAVADYLPTIPTTPAGIMRAFASVREKQYTAEWLDTYPAATPKAGESSTKAAKRRQASAYRALQKYGLRGGAKETKKVTRKPDKNALAKMRRIFIARSFPAQISVRGTIGYNDADMRRRSFTVSQVPTDGGKRGPVGPDELRAILAVAAAVDDGARVTWGGGAPVAVGGDGDGPDNGESIAHNIFTGWYFLATPTNIMANGARIARQSYDETLRYEDDCVFAVSKVLD